MSQLDIHIVLRWWTTLFFIGILFFPLTRLLFPKFADRGYIFAKTTGIIAISYLALVAGIFHLVHFERNTLLLFATLPLFCYTTWIAIIRRKNIRSAFRLPKNLKNLLGIILIEEIMFLLGLFFLSAIRSFSPDIHGLEKYMDVGFVNSILRADYFPARDMWFPPFPINYYYFGHLATAVLTQINNLPTSVTYNLMLATLFSLCLTSCFSLGINFFALSERKIRWLSKKTVLAGVLAACIVTFGGNLHTIYTLFTPYENEKPVPPWTLHYTPFTFPNSYWYPNATRFIHNTIHEFPMYSWTVSDLHGHVLDIPFVLLTIAVLLSFFTLSQTRKKITILFNLKHMALIGFLLAVLYMTNAWDGIIYFLLAGGVLLYLQYIRVIKEKRGKTTSNPLLYLSLGDTGREQELRTFFLQHRIIDILSGVFTYIAVLGFSLFVFSQPFTHFFKPFVSGVGVLCAPQFLTKIGHFGPLLFEVDHCQKSPLWQLLILHGFFYFFVFSFFIFLFRQKKYKLGDIFVLLLITLSTLLIILPEFLYAKDIYPAHYRANTMFKLVFESFIMLGISSGYIVVRILTHLSSALYQKNLAKKIITLCYLLLSLGLLTLIFIYPHLAINGYYGSLKTYYGLDGTKYLANLYPSDYKAILWINENIKNQPVILEAQGDSYTDFARVSSNTGLPTVLGWTVHEWLWRGSYDVPSPRIAEVTTMYETTDIQEANKLLQKYHVAYIFIGALEYQKYPKLNENKFAKLGRIVFQSEKTKIYKLY